MATDGPYSKTEQGEVEIGRSSTQSLVRSDQFYTKAFTQEGREFFIFSRIGDHIKGFLLGGSSDNTHFNRGKSYKLRISDGKQHGEKLDCTGLETIEFFGNRQLHRLIKNHELANKLIRIVFIGRKKSAYTTHSAKVYRVFIDKGFVKESEVECNEPPRRKKRKSVKRAAGRTADRAAGRAAG